MSNDASVSRQCSAVHTARYRFCTRSSEPEPREHAVQSMQKHHALSSLSPDFHAYTLSANAYRYIRLMHAHPYRTWATKLSVKSALVLLWRARPIRVIERGCIYTTQHNRYQYPPDESTSSWRHVCVFVEREQSQDILVLVNWLAEIPPLLLVPPVCVRVSELSLDCWRVEISAVLESISVVLSQAFIVYIPSPDHDSRDPLLPGVVLESSAEALREQQGCIVWWRRELQQLWFGGRLWVAMTALRQSKVVAKALSESRRLRSTMRAFESCISYLPGSWRALT